MKLVILDRDGVINYDSDDYIKSPEEWHPIPGSLDAIARLNNAGFCVVVATNQSGVARGLYDLAMLDRIHQKMQQSLKAHGGHIDAIFFCPHTPSDECDCRKPKPGLFWQIAKHFQISLTGVPSIGDSARDIKAAQAVGCESILVLTGNGVKTRENNDPLLQQVTVFSDLAAAVDHLISGLS